MRFLGPIDVDGVVLRDKCLAVLAFLAVRRSASGDAVEDACWSEPSSGPARKRLKDIVSECRAALGTDHIPRASGGIYSVGPNVSTDLDLFNQAVERAGHKAGSERARSLREALGLVRGRVFAYPARSTASFGWIDLENLVSHWELRIEDTAEECALLLADADQGRDAVEVLLRALEVLPLNVRLTEALMSVHAAAGDHDMVDLVFRAHRDGLARVHGCEPEESTVDLRAELLAGQRRRR